MGRKKKAVVRDEDGLLKEIAVEAEIADFKEPMANDAGVIPQYVNVSTKIQYLSVPNDPNTIEVDRFGILRGEQWRYIVFAKSWGGNSPFVERKHVNGKFDEKYLLTEEQMIKEIGRITRRKGVRELIDNAVIVGETERGREDRHEVQDAALKQYNNIEEREAKRRQELGITEQESVY